METHAPAEVKREEEEVKGQVDRLSPGPPLKPGDIIKGTVVQIDRDGVLVDIGRKTEGFIPAEEFSAVGGPHKELKPGDVIDVYVVRGGGSGERMVLLSKRRADYEKAWRRIVNAYKSGETISAVVVEKVKGGLVVDLGFRGFVPASEVGLKRMSDAELERMVGRSLRLKVIGIDARRREAILSNKQALLEERERRRRQVLESLAPGRAVRGKVTKVVDFGAFVDLGGGVEGLLHVSEMSWTRVNDPREVVKEGDWVTVMILDVDKKNERISLSLRQLYPDPWKEAPKKHPVGSTRKGKVTRLVPTGAFVRLEGREGLEGFVPISEISTRRIGKPEDVLKVGQTVEVKVLEVNPEERRMTLSIRQAKIERERRETEEIMRMQERQRPKVTLGDIYGDVLAKLKERPSGGEKEGASSS
ncbi:MAG TPA: 30S ribosomal protein S1 [Armatimonadetes bacterium]|nr:30S ribosomal protein S1 [Armatimonadota bacterium]